MQRVTLTFDNGPTAGVTDKVLRLLERHAIRTTFFVIGRKLDDAAAAEQMLAAHAAGHWIGNHTLTHSVAFGDRLDPAYAAQEINETQARIAAVSRPERLFRPYGNSGLIGPHLFSRAALDILYAGRFRTVLWSSVPGDWKDPDGWVDRCIADVTGQAWAVSVLHDIEGACLARLPELLDRLQAQGTVFEQDFPDSVIVTSEGRPVSLQPDHVADFAAPSGNLQ